VAVTRIQLGRQGERRDFAVPGQGPVTRQRGLEVPVQRQFRLQLGKRRAGPGIAGEALHQRRQIEPFRRHVQGEPGAARADPAEGQIRGVAHQSQAHGDVEPRRLLRARRPAAGALDPSAEEVGVIVAAVQTLVIGHAQASENSGRLAAGPAAIQP
jgi:hypothetical protein